ncbi:MAG: argJ [Phycisphaerales bacterium]|nr:argJ [Phycisphaerales bacterium]
MPDLHLLSPRGFRAGGVHAGIKTTDTPDIGLLVADAPAAAVAAFTTNKVFAAPVKVGRIHAAGGRLRAVVLNSGNANACTGRQGERDAFRMCTLAAELVGCDAAHVLPSSTGIIGHPLPMEKVEAGIRDVAQYLGDSLEHALLFGSAILTTDTKRKAAAATVKIGRETVTLAGVCKGAGMIGPRMAVQVGAAAGGGAGGAAKAKGRSLKGRSATLLSYLTTDAKIAPAALRKLFAPTVDASFNAVTIDDHTSTNDTAVLLASGASAAVAGDRDLAKFKAALDEVCQSLAYQIAADGEGATKVVVVRVRGADTDADARAMARAIANSPLVKCAMNGNDPNWGRIVSAAGLAGVPFDPDRATLTLQGTAVFRNGQPLTYDAAAVSTRLAEPEVRVDLTCKQGKGDGTVWTCDLSKEYVSINADYHT